MVKQKTVTEETYNLIINLYGEGNNYISELNRYSDASNYFDGVRFETIVSILNPLTRDWAHDQFVEKEKKFYWRTKKKDNCDIRLHLNMNKYDSVESSYNRATPLTETEIREWGYNPDYYDKEEVD